MTTQEHLNKILEKCRAFLEIAGKRTPGEWNAFHAQSSICVGVNQPCDSIEDLNRSTHIEVFGDGNRENDAAFIAACAGQAEAMARSTIAAIEWLVPEAKLSPLASAAIARQVLEAIIATWPEELL